MSKATFDPNRYNLSNNPDFQSVLEQRIKRRSLLRSGGAFAGLAVMANVGLTGCDSNDNDNSGGGNPDPTPQPALELGFDSIMGSKTDAVVVPQGYKASILAPWGTPLNDNAADWKEDGTNTAADQANSVGMHHDGMRYYPLNGSNEDGLLCMNHEYVDQDFLHPNGVTRDATSDLRTSAEEVRKEINAHGVTVARIQKVDGEWVIVKNDPHNQRFTGATEMELSGPVAGTDAVMTKFSPQGTTARGTLNNCGNGYTPWNTYLTCEENWPDYFVNTTPVSERPLEQNRLGIGTDDSRYSWDDVAGDPSEQNDEFTRFDMTPSGDSALMDYRNEANGHGYIVEINPYNPDAPAVKRTALGRFRHEGCVPGLAEAGKPIVFYSGHDGRFEYVYKFVSNANWDPADADRADKLNVGAKYMDEGTLYVARFNADGTGTWVPLVPETATMADEENSLPASTLGDELGTIADIIINTPYAADRVAATPMDRPEWGAVDHTTGAVYMTMTNNTRRTEDTNAANPRLNNAFGHIIRWEEGDSPEAFTWDIFIFGAPDDAVGDVNKSGLTGMNQFASPDGLVFDERGIMWIQTDNGADEVTEETNDQMLAIIPSTLAEGTTDNDVIVDSSNQAALRRFFVGPNGCEVTGLTYTPNYNTFFANIQHPGNWPYSNDASEATPAGMTLRARDATVVIEKVDGGEVGV